MKNNILHISYDYTDVSHPEKTLAIKNLVDITGHLAKTAIISMDRTSNLRKESASKIQDGIHIQCFGLPCGIFLRSHLERGFQKILKSTNLLDLPLSAFDLIHAHKLTFEGYIGYRLARQLNRPLFISLRQTDYYVLHYRKDLVPLFKKILLYASTIFYIAPFMIVRLERIFGKKFVDEIHDKLICLPNRVEIKSAKNPKPPAPDQLLTVAKMTPFKIRVKNLKKLMEAFSQIRNCHLNIIGDGPCRNQVESWIEKYNLSDSVSLLGQVDHHRIADYYQKASAFVMPSHEETFGLVYIEALMNGTPILYSRGTGVDGYFENVGVAVNPKSVKSIANGIETLMQKNAFYREQIQDLIRNNAFNIFSESSIEATCRKRLELL